MNNEKKRTDHTYTDFKFILLGQLVSLLGSSITNFAIIWWITITTGSALMLALASFMTLGIQSIATLFSGVIIDRYSRKLLIIVTDLLEAVFTVILIILFIFNYENMIYILIILGFKGLFQGLHEPTVRVIVASMVPEEKLKGINSLKFLFEGLIGLLSPLLSAVLIGIFGIENIEGILMIDGVTFIIAVVVLFFVDIPLVREKDKVKVPFMIEFKEGFSFVKTKTGLLPLLITFNLLNFIQGPLIVLYPLVVADEDLFNENEMILAITLIFFQGGIILAAIIINTVPLFKKFTSGIGIGFIVQSIALLLIPLSIYLLNLHIFYLAAALFGIAVALVNVHSSLIWQSVVPLDMQGRVFAIRSTIALMSAPIAYLLTGFIVQFASILTIFTVVSICVVILCLISWFLTSIPHIDETNVNK
ncbi:MAG: MFS transporter [Candidatus Heimdallarchaeota archaeon]|nr:MFS transporter [Candidatus Heimdallarchaeota archaeon]